MRAKLECLPKNYFYFLESSHKNLNINMIQILLLEI